MITMAISTSVVILALWLPATGNAPLIVFAALYGFVSGAGISLVPAICASIAPLQEIGTRTGLSIAIASFAALTGAPIGGKIVSDDRGSFKYTKVFSGVSCLIGTALFVLTRYIHAGKAKKA
jgi:MFS family permease